MTQTRGDRSSERRASYHAFLAGILLACIGLYLNADLTALGWLIGAVCSPIMVYTGARTALKRKTGETDD
jgi:Na+/H+-translocating membrane pyrophosphatase